MTAAGGNHCPVGVMRRLKQRHPSSPCLIISNVSMDKGKGRKKNMISPSWCNAFYWPIKQSDFIFTRVREWRPRVRCNDRDLRALAIV